jgi:hypothetical protein
LELLEEKKTKQNFSLSQLSNKINFEKFIEKSKLKDVKEGEKIKVKLEINISEEEKIRINKFLSDEKKKDLEANKLHTFERDVEITFNKTASRFSNDLEIFNLHLFLTYFY